MGEGKRIVCGLSTLGEQVRLYRGKEEEEEKGVYMRARKTGDS